MSSMHRTMISTALAMLAFWPLQACAQEDGSEWDRARSSLKALPQGNMHMAVSRWKLLSSSDRFLFSDYAQFMLTYPGFPEEAKMRVHAERALDREAVEPQRLAAFFDRFPPATNVGRAAYALALYALGRDEAEAIAREAWRGGAMSDAAEAALLTRLAAKLTKQDHDARMDALLWAGATTQGERQIQYVSSAAQPGLQARLDMAKGLAPAAEAPASGTETRDAGYVYNRSKYLRTAGNTTNAAWLLATRPPLTAPPRDTRKWLAELLAVARKADAQSAVKIAAGIDDTFPPGTDVSTQSYMIRDDYTSLMWLGGTRALNSLGDGARAAPLFWRYGAAARTPQTRSKGFYWAGRAMAQSGNAKEAARYFEMAAAYSDQYYGMLALERLGRPLPPLESAPMAVPSEAERQTFNARPLTLAVREVARESDWQTAVKFFREIAEQAQSEADHVLVADLARELGRRDIGVILGQAAHADGHGVYRKTSYPIMPITQGANWTMVHAITRQESQFAMNAVSHAGARGLMQLMPGTAREQAGKLQMSYDMQGLTQDAGYNIMLGDAYFARMMDYFGGSYPLAVAAYNAGPGNVNKWLRANGDPRSGGIDWVEWIERIPLSETRNYVQRVLENAVVYEAMYPARARHRGANPLSQFLGKRYPG
jgi:soluble lytic murein transglycosylase